MTPCFPVTVTECAQQSVLPYVGTALEEAQGKQNASQDFGCGGLARGSLAHSAYLAVLTIAKPLIRFPSFVLFCDGCMLLTFSTTINTARLLTSYETRV